MIVCGHRGKLSVVCYVVSQTRLGIIYTSHALTHSQFGWKWEEDCSQIKHLLIGRTRLTACPGEAETWWIRYSYVWCSKLRVTTFGEREIPGDMKDLGSLQTSRLITKAMKNKIFLRIQISTQVSRFLAQMVRSYIILYSLGGERGGRVGVCS